MAKGKLTPKDKARPRRDFGKEDVLSRLHYDPETGVFTWKVRVMSHGGGKAPGDVAGAVRQYILLTMFGLTYRAHHIAWLVMTGEWPPTDMDIDHIDGDKHNNAWSNLRLATRSQNNMNTSQPRSDNTSGYRGVYRLGRGNGWFARISVNGKIVHLGCFPTFEAAKRARVAQERKVFGQFVEQASI